MKKSLLLFGFVGMFVSKLLGQQLIKGLLVNDLGIGVQQVNVLNSERKLLVKSNDFGAFKVQVSVGDTLYFTHISYEEQRYIVPALVPERIKIVMAQQMYRLPEFALKRKNDSLALAMAFFMKSDSLLNNFRRYTHFPSKPVLHAGGGPFGGAIVLEGLITAVWYKLSDKGKEMEKLKRLIALYQQELKVDERFNSSFIQAICACKEEELERIKSNCRPRPDWLIGKSDYDLAVYIRNCWYDGR